MTQQEKEEWMNRLLGDELIAHLQYKIASATVVGTDYDSCATEFDKHANEEYDHFSKLLEKMVQEHLHVNPDLLSLIKNSQSGYTNMTRVDSEYFCKFMWKAEKDAIRAYKEFYRKIDDGDVTLKHLIRDILEDEIEHRTDLEKILTSILGSNTMIASPSDEDNALFSSRVFTRESFGL